MRYVSASCLAFVLFSRIRIGLTSGVAQQIREMNDRGWDAELLLVASRSKRTGNCVSVFAASQSLEQG
jgi:hypothetical protein